MVGTSKSVLTNSIPLMSKSSLAIFGKSRVFHTPFLTSSTSAHWAIEMSSLIIRGVAFASFKPIIEAATKPVAPHSRDFSINFLLSIYELLFFILLILNNFSYTRNSYLWAVKNQIPMISVWSWTYGLVRIKCFLPCQGLATVSHHSTQDGKHGAVGHEFTIIDRRSLTNGS